MLRLPTNNRYTRMAARDAAAREWRKNHQEGTMSESFTFSRAERRKARLRLGLVGPSGSGKTYTSLLIARGLGARIALIDTEAKSAELFSDLCEYDTCQIGAPFTPERYVTAIHAAEAAGYGTIIVDSLSHAWAGEGGCLDIQGRIADSGKGNSYTAWRSVTPKHNALVEALLQSPSHIIVTMRAKTDYVLVDDGKGKSVPKKVGMAPVQRDGMDYEMTVVLELDQQHQATASKDRTRLFDCSIFKPDTSTGEKLLAWLESGTDRPAPPITKPDPTPEQQSQHEREAHHDEDAIQPMKPTPNDYEKRLRAWVAAHGGDWSRVSKIQSGLGLGDKGATKLPPEQIAKVLEKLECAA